MQCGIKILNQVCAVITSSHYPNDERICRMSAVAEVVICRLGPVSLLKIGLNCSLSNGQLTGLTILNSLRDFF